MLLKNILEAKPIEESSAHSYDRAQWFANVQDYYIGGKFQPWCSVLGFLFPNGRYDFGISVVAEHLIPRQQATTAHMLAIELHHPRNGILLCRHLEKLFQAGHWSLVPLSYDDETHLLSCRVHVSQDYRETRLYDFCDAKPRRPLMVKLGPGQLEHLSMEALHGQEVKLRRPYIRSLFLKNLMASGEHKELPNPMHRSRIGTYKSLCTEPERMNMDVVLAGSVSQMDDDEELQPEAGFGISPPTLIIGQLEVQEPAKSSSSQSREPISTDQQGQRRIWRSRTYSLS